MAEHPGPRPGSLGALLADARLVAAKDLRLEWRSRVILSQVLPFAVLVLILFAFALDPDRRILGQATPGLYWLAVLFSTLLALQRSFTVEAENGVTDSLRMSGLDPGGVFLGKTAGIALHLVALQLVLLAGVTVFYGTTPHGPLLLLAAGATATLGLAAIGSILGVMAAGLKVRDSLLPLLMLPMVAPVLIGASQAFTAAYDRDPGAGWRWIAMLGVFGCLYTAIGIVAFEPLLEET